MSKLLYTVKKLALVFICILWSSFSTQSFSLGFMLLLSGTCCGLSYYSLRSMFHQGREKGILTSVLNDVMGYGTIAGIYMLCLLLGRNDVLNSSLPTQKRISSMEYNGMFNPAFDLKTFKELEPFMGDSKAKKVLYEKITFNPSVLGVDYFLEKGRYSTRLLDFLLKGNADSKFLLSLYEHFEKNPDYWKDKFELNRLKHIAFNHWPKNEQLPEKYLTAKNEILKNRTRIQRQTASESK